MEKPKRNESTELNLLNMIESRIMEVVQIEDECKKKLPKLFNQRLPRFMRRRAACHDPKRLPRRMRAPGNSAYGSKSRKPLLRYRQRLRFRKHKRVLQKHDRASKDPYRCLLHKWFAKRFKMDGLRTMDSKIKSITHIPLYNNTKNQRNLSRQARYGCAYLAFAHLMPVQLDLAPQTDYRLDNQLNQLNKMANETASFTFCARSLRQGQYEVKVNLLFLDALPCRRYLCLVRASLRLEQREGAAKDVGTKLTIWIPRPEYEQVYKQLQVISSETEPTFTLKKVYPRDWTRVRLVGPDAYEEAQKLASDKDEHKAALEDTHFRLNPMLGLSIGRCVEEEFANFVYFNSKPKTVDIVFKGKGGRMLWHKLIKNKAHLVGGYRESSK